MRKNKFEKHLVVEKSEPATGYYLGCYIRCRENPNSGAIHIVELCDGSHSDEQGVADAYELFQQFGFIQEGQYVMVKIEPLPNLEPKINKSEVKAVQKMLLKTSK